jgi:hypothetical protein
MAIYTYSGCVKVATPVDTRTKQRSEPGQLVLFKQRGGKRRGAGRKHREDLRAPMSGWTIDWFSSAAMFTGWAEYGDEPFLWRGPATYDPLLVYQPKRGFCARAGGVADRRSRTARSRPRGAPDWRQRRSVS